MRKLTLFILLGLGCSTETKPPKGTGGASAGGKASGGTGATGEGGANGGSASEQPSGGALPTPEPKYHPPPGFETCKHVEVRADCKDGWCKLPPSCFVMGSPESEWERGRDTESQAAVNLTHLIEIQQKELTRSEWESITKTSAPGPDNCTDASCPVATVSWWDAIFAANQLSESKGLAPCYEPVECAGTQGKDLACTGVAEPDKSVYECEGYRLPTRAEAEYAARAGTISTFYSGDITPYDDDRLCVLDPALELIGWYCYNSGGRAHKGGELKANGFGLFDMIGNLGEWNNEEQHYQSSPGGNDPRGSVGTNRNRMRFAPQYDLKSYLVRTANLLSAPWDASGNQGGFRLVRTIDPKP
jgi:formylglycine-generating enzyme